jgi:hypothetical protein
LVIGLRIPSTPRTGKGFRLRVAVSHISRKTSEMWGTP